MTTLPIDRRPETTQTTPPPTTPTPTTPTTPTTRPTRATASAVARTQVLHAVRTGLRSLAEAPWSGQQADHLLGLLREALAVSERTDDGTSGRAAPAIRAACAHLAARQNEDAYLALQCAQERFGEL